MTIAQASLAADSEALFVPPKYDVFGQGVTATDYDELVEVIIQHAKARRPLSVSALAVHGLMESTHSRDFQQVVNELDVVTPDGQPVRWALNKLHGLSLCERVYGPDLTRFVLAAMEQEGLSAFFFGSSEDTCELLISRLNELHPNLRISGYQADRFREATPDENRADDRRIADSGADVVFCGRGCPRQERWAHDHRDALGVPVLAVGAAFDYIAGNLTRPPAWMQRHGLEWLARLLQEPGRLWRRYFITNTQFVYHFAVALLKQRRGKLAGETSGSRSSSNV